MKAFLLSLGLLMVISSQGQLIQGTIKPGTANNSVDVFITPDFSNTAEYIFQIGLPIAFDASIVPVPIAPTAELDASFISTFGANYTITVYPMGHNTSNTSNYYAVSIVRGGTGASIPQTWTAGVEYKVCTVTFQSTAGLSSVRLADYQDEGSDYQGNFYTADGDGNYYVTTNSIGNFYNGYVGGNQVSFIGGNSNEGYVSTTMLTNCTGAVGGTASVTGPSGFCGSGTPVITAMGYSTGTGSGYQWQYSNDNFVADINDFSGQTNPASLVTGTVTSTVYYRLKVTCSTGNATDYSNIVTITVNPVPIAGITNNSGVTELNCNNTSICVTATGGVSYSWSGGSTPGTADNCFDAPGVYTVTVTGANGCTATASIATTQNNTPPSAGISNPGGVTELTCTTTSICVTATGGDTYAWSGGDTPTTAGNCFEAPGTYTVTVTGANGCTATASIAVTQNISSPGAGINNNTGSTELNCTTTEIDVMATGNGLYAWSGGLGNNANAVITAPGTYTVTVTGANGCTATASIAATQNTTSPNAGINNNTGSTELNCTIPEIDVMATGDGTYAWSGGLGNNANAVITAPGTYTVTVTGANGCTATASIAATQNTTTPGAGINNNTGSTELNCTTTEIDVMATGNGSYAWSGGLGNNANAVITAPGVYTVTVTGANGCTATASIAVTQNISSPGAGINNNTGSTELNCTTTEIDVMATGNGLYAWSGGLGNNANAVITAPGTYTVTVTGANGCTATASIAATQNTTSPNAGINNNTGSTELNCVTSEIDVMATGNGTYAWSDGLGNSANAVITAPGVYTVTVTGANGCTATASIAATQNTTPPSAGVSNPGGNTILTCAITSICVTATGGSTYSWSGGATPTTAANCFVTPGTYTVTVTGANGCTATASIAITQNITVPAAPSVGTVTQPNCTTATGSVVLNGLPAGNWTINPGGITGSGSSTTITGLIAGTYNFTVTNDVGCTSSADVVVINQQPATNAPIVGTITQLTCSVATGSVVLNGLPAGNWTINPGGITGSGSSTTISGLVAGTYNYTVTPAVGCTSPASADIVINTQPAIPDVNQPLDQIGANNAPTAAVVFTGSVPGALYSWTNDNPAIGLAASGTGNIPSFLAINNTTTPVTATITVTPSKTYPGGITCTGNAVSFMYTIRPMIYATMKRAGSNKVDIYLKPDFSSNSDYLYQMQFPIAFPASASPTTAIAVSLDSAFVANFGTYSAAVYDRASNTAGTVNYMVISLNRTVSAFQTLTAGTEFKVLTVTLMNSPGLNETDLKLADFQDGGSDGQGGFYTADGLYNIYYYSTNSIANFYPAPGQSFTGGNSSEGYVRLLTCSGAIGGTATGAATFCTSGTPSITATGYSTELGISYQWQYSNNNFVSDIHDFTGQTNPAILTTGVVSTTTWFRLKVSCATNSAITFSNTVIITVNPLPVAGITNNTGSTVLTCLTTSISVTATGGTTYTWSGGLGANANAAISAPGTYTVTVSNGPGCTATASIAATLNTTPPTAGITNNSGTSILTCATTSICVTATGGSTYAWSGGATPATAGNCFAAPGTYTVTVTGANGCTATASIAISQNITAPTAGITNNSGATQLTCTRTAISVTATGGVSYAWNGGVTPGTAANSFSAPGTYTVTVTGANGCTATTSIVITQNITAPAAGISTNTGTTVLTCTSTSLILTANGTGTYAWSGSLGSTASITVSAPASYTVTVTGANGCTTVSSITITRNITPPTAGITNNTGTTILTCTTTSISVTATGGVSYSWSGSLGNNAGAVITTAGTYTVTVTGVNGCTATASIAVTQNITAPTVGVTNNSGTTVFNCTTTSICVTATGGGTYAWSGGSTPGTAANCFAAPGTYTVTVTGTNGCTATASITFTQSPPAITASTGGNGTVTPAGTSSLTCGGNITYTITPASCYHISTVLVDGVNNAGAVTSGSYAFTNVTASHTISASFAINGPYSLIASAGSNGSISPLGTTSVACGGRQTYTITPNTCYHVADVLVDGVSVGAVTTFTFNPVTANHTISVTFAINTYSIVASTDGNGTITPAGTTTVNCAGSQTYTITANACYHLLNVLADGVSVGAVTTYTFSNVSANHTISATFAINGPFSITATTGSNGTVSPSGVTTVTCGNSQVYTITPSACYHVATVLVDGVSVGAVTTFTFSNVTANHTISATFAINTNTITASATVNGTITPAGVTTLNCGGSQSYTIAPAACYSIGDVQVDGVSVGAVASYTFSNVTTNHTISASFVINGPYTITASAGANGQVVTTPGGVSGTITLTCGSRQDYQIIPASCYHINQVLVDGVPDVNAALSGTYTFNNVTANHTISATFALNGPYTITATSNSNGTINPSGVTNANCGMSVTYNFAANSGYHIYTVLIDGVNNPAAVTSGTYTFSNVGLNHTIDVQFASNCSATTVSITASSPNDFCANLVLTAVPAIPGVYTYQWLRGTTVVGTAQTLTLTTAMADGAYSVTATGGTCTSPAATYTYTKQNVLQTYTLLGMNIINLGESNTVQNGSVGNTGNNGTIAFKKNATVASSGAFVKAKTITIDNPSNVPLRFLGQVSVTLPTMQLNTASTSGLRNITVTNGQHITLNGNYNDVTIQKNAVVTLTGNIFHNISMEDGAQLTFSSSLVNITQLNPGNSGGGGSTPTKVIFTGNCSLRINNSVTTGGNCQINPTSKNVVFYLGTANNSNSNFTVNGANTWVIASVYIPVGTLDVKQGPGATICHMTGRFIAQNITSEGKNVIWNSYDCSNPPTPLFAPVTPEMVSAKAEDAVKPVSHLEVRAYPNPSENGFNLVLKNQGTGEVTVRILDLSGKLMKTFTGSPDKLYRVGDDLKPGLYIAEVMQGNEKTMVKLVKQQ